MVERNAAVAREKRIEFRVGINVGDTIAMGTTSSATARTSPLVLKESRSQATFASPKLPTRKGRWRRGCFSAGLTAYRSSVRLLIAPG